MDDLFIKDLERKFSHAGYAFWFKTLELIAAHGEGGKLTISWSNYLDKLHMRRALVEQLLTFCETFAKLLWNFCGENVEISCPKFSEYADNFTKYGRKLQSDFEVTSKQEEEGEEEGDKKKKRVKSGTRTPKDNGKVEFAEFVHMTQEQYEKLLAKLGSADRLAAAITILDNYKGQSEKNKRKYTDDYRAMLSWVLRALEEREAKDGAHQQGSSQTRREVTRADLERASAEVKRRVGG